MPPFSVLSQLVESGLKKGAAYSSLGRNKVLSTPRCESQIPAKETKVLVVLDVD